MELHDKLHVVNRDDWRAWLERYCDSRKEVWLVFYKRHTDKPNIAYDDAVEEALCFGWIDSIIKKIDEEKFARNFTHRKPDSKWSELNKRRAEKMIRKGRMTKKGLVGIEAAKKSGEWFKTHPSEKKLQIPPRLKEALAQNKRASDNFNLAQSYKRQYILWISTAKKEETRRRRILEAIRLLEQNEKLGMK